MIAKATRDLQNETGRQAKGITPVELGSDEIYNILRTRLLTAEPEKRWSTPSRRPFPTPFRTP